MQADAVNLRPEDLIPSPRRPRASASNSSSRWPSVANVVIHHHRDPEATHPLCCCGRGLFQLILERFGRIDIVVNNAGVTLKKNMADITEEEFDSAFATNTKAPFFMREAAKHLVDEGRVTYVGTSLQVSWSDTILPMLAARLLSTCSHVPWSRILALAASWTTWLPMVLWTRPSSRLRRRLRPPPSCLRWLR
ncbi:hypothetical protein MVEG_05940 [Podila verticillata NRRL 6337]|nr:hypothetical protein MVEG_05940 [Podila verticillata NRRL 6337]